MDLLSKFRHKECLAEDPRTKIAILLGTIEQKDAVLIVEKTAVNTSLDGLAEVICPQGLTLDECNDVYYKFFSELRSDSKTRPSAKYTLIYPATKTVSVSSRKYTKTY